MAIVISHHCHSCCHALPACNNVVLLIPWLQLVDFNVDFSQSPHIITYLIEDLEVFHTESWTLSLWFCIIFPISAHWVLHPHIIEECFHAWFVIDKFFFRDPQMAADMELAAQITSLVGQFIFQVVLCGCFHLTNYTYTQVSIHTISKY